MKTIPNFFIVGKPKSGTTSIHFMLNQHPEIFMCPVKEPHHFARDHIEASIKRNRGYRGLPYKDREKYLALFSDVRGEKVVGESSTDYLYSHRAADEIAKFNPDAKILMLFREPTDFLYSFHSQLIRSGNETESRFDKALALEGARKKGAKVPATTSNPAILFYSEQVKYAEQAARYIRVFDRENIKVIIYEDFRDDNLTVCQDVFRFLGVDPNFEPEVEVRNPTSQVRALTLANWLIYHGDRKAGSFKEKAPSWLQRPVSWFMRKLFFSNRPGEPMDPALRLKLAAQSEPDVIELSSIVGVDLLKRWNY